MALLAAVRRRSDYQKPHGEVKLRTKVENDKRTQKITFRSFLNCLHLEKLILNLMSSHMVLRTLPPCLLLRVYIRAHYDGIYRCTITFPAGAIQLVKKNFLLRKKYRRMCQKIKAPNLPTKFRSLRPQNVLFFLFLHKQANCFLHKRVEIVLPTANTTE